MNKKAQGISLDVIIIAAIVLIVLIVLVAIFLGSPVTNLPGDVAKVAPTELIKVQASSSSRCKPSRFGVEQMKLGLEGYSEAEYQSYYESGVRNLIDTCSMKISMSQSDLTNRDRCSQDTRCQYI
jgi:hypothetical protein